MDKLKEQLLSYQKAKTFENLLTKVEGQETLKLFDFQNEKLMENQLSHRKKLEEIDYKQRLKMNKFA